MFYVTGDKLANKHVIEVTTDTKRLKRQVYHCHFRMSGISFFSKLTLLLRSNDRLANSEVAEKIILLRSSRVTCTDNLHSSFVKSQIPYVFKDGWSQAGDEQKKMSTKTFCNPYLIILIESK